MEMHAPSAQSCIEPQCAASYNINDRHYSCSECGGLLEISRLVCTPEDASALPSIWEARRKSHEPRDLSGVWRYRELLPFGDDAPLVTLNEGNTPLYDAPRCALYCGLDSLRLKHQGCNPTGSFKDTGMTTAVTQALVLRARTLLCASTGNTAASLAAYAARANLQSAILIPQGQVSHGKLAQSLDYGARVFEIDGNFDDCMRLVRELAEDSSIYLVNSINPFRIEGQKTAAVELMEQLNWQAPDHVVVPGGNLGNSTALGKGFIELFDLGLIKRLPKLSVIQAEGAAPFARAFANNDLRSFATGSIPNDLLTPVTQPKTQATAIKIGAPVSWKKSLRAVLRTGGRVTTVTESEIADAKAMVGREGIGCEPASATTVAGIKRLVAGGFIDSRDNVVAVLTGHVLKDADYVIDYHVNERASKSKTVGRKSGFFGNAPLRVEANASSVLEHLKRSHDTASL